MRIEERCCASTTRSPQGTVDGDASRPFGTRFGKRAADGVAPYRGHAQVGSAMTDFARTIKPGMYADSAERPSSPDRGMTNSTRDTESSIPTNANRSSNSGSNVKLVIEPGTVAKNYWRDLWRYRELVYFLAWRDIAVRYKQTIIGIAWALIRPALTMLVFVGFRRLVGLPSGAVPDPLLVFAAVVPWQFFSSGLSDSASSLISNANLVS